MINSKKADSKKYKDHHFWNICNRIYSNFHDFLTRSANIWCSIVVQENTVRQNGDNAWKLKTLSDKIANPGAHQHHWYFGVEILFIFISLLSDTFFHLLFFWLIWVLDLQARDFSTTVCCLSLLNKGYNQSSHCSDKYRANEYDKESTGCTT